FLQLLGDLGVDAGDVVLLLHDLDMQQVLLAQQRADHADLGDGVQQRGAGGKAHDAFALAQGVDACGEFLPALLHGWAPGLAWGADCRLNSTYEAGAAAWPICRLPTGLPCMTRSLR